MRLVIRLIGALVLCVLLVSVCSSYYQVQREKRHLRNELQKRAEVLGDSLQTNVETLLRASAAGDLQRKIQRFANKEYLLGIAVYGDRHTAAAMTPSLAARLPEPPPLVAQSMAEDRSAGQFVRVAGTQLHLYALPLHGDTGVIGSLLIVHDASSIAAATVRAWRDMSVRVIVQICLMALITFIVFQRSVMPPLARTATWMRDLRNGHPAAEPAIPESDMFSSLRREATSFARSLADARASAQQEAQLRETAESLWTAERLAVCLRSKLKGSRLFVVANREPYMHTRQGRAVQVVVPASGLVTGLEPILRACDGTWVAHGSGSADRETVDERNCLRVPPDGPRYTLRRVWLNKEEEAGYYLGFSNEGLWPLCHIAHTRPIFRAADWEQYKKVNATFADAVLEEMADTEHPVVIVQDYHYALLPKLIKQRRPDARVGIFWHIPWPNAEAFGICPWQRELLEGLLGADLVGFHIQAHCANFLETVDVALECRLERERFAVSRNDHSTLVRPFPISVAFPDPPAALPAFHAHQAALLEKMGAEALYLGVGVDRIDYTKGILERFHGVERFLEKYPQYQGKFSFVQIGAPSRTDIKRYHDFLMEVEEEAERINRRFGAGRWSPILLRKWHHSHAEVEGFYQAADLCMVTSLHDGMNLVAKEFLVSRHDEEGVLLLSPFTGAARELSSDALIVNPYDTESMADAIFTALEMDPAQRKSRMRHMRALVKQQNVYRWAGELIGELCAVRTAPLRSLGPRESRPLLISDGGEAEQPLHDFDDTCAVSAGSH